MIPQTIFTYKQNTIISTLISSSCDVNWSAVQNAEKSLVSHQKVQGMCFTVKELPGYKKFEPLHCVNASMLSLADERDNNEPGEISQTAGASPHWWKSKMKTTFLNLILNE